MPQLADLEKGEGAVIMSDVKLPVKAMELGIMKGSRVKMLKKNPRIGMTLIEVNGQSLALDYNLAKQIEVSKNGKKKNNPAGTHR